MTFFDVDPATKTHVPFFQGEAGHEYYGTELDRSLGASDRGRGSRGLGDARNGDGARAIAGRLSRIDDAVGVRERQ